MYFENEKLMKSVFQSLKHLERDRKEEDSKWDEDDLENEFGDENLLDRRTALEVFNAVGNTINTLSNLQLPGKYQVNLNAKAEHLAAGIYTVRLTADNAEMNKRITIMR